MRASLQVSFSTSTSSTKKGPPTKFRFLIDLVKWGIKDLYRYTQPVRYNDAKGGIWIRPVGYDDRPLPQQLREKWIWIRVVYGIRRGWVGYIHGWKEDITRVLGRRTPSFLIPPPEIPFPPRPQRFSSEFIKSERERMRRLNLPPSKFPEFNEPIDPQGGTEGNNNMDLKTLRNLFRNNEQVRKATAKSTELGNQLASRVTGAKSQMESLQSRYDTEIKSSQAFADTLRRGEFKKAAGDVKSLYTNVKNNQELKDTLDDKKTATQEVLKAFIAGYHEGKKEEELLQSDPRQLLNTITAQAKKFTVLAAKETPNLMNAGMPSDFKDLQSRVTNFAEKAKNVDEITEEDERLVKEQASKFLAQKHLEIVNKTTELRKDFENSKEGQALKQQMDKAAELKIKSQEIITTQGQHLRNKTQEFKEEIDKKLQ